MTVRVAHGVLVLLGVVALTGCGHDYEPTEGGPPAGAEAAPVGQVLDVDVGLPHLSFPGRPAGVGATLDVRFDLPTARDGSHQAEVAHLGATVGGESVEVEEVFSGDVMVTISGGSWQTGRIGPISIEGTGFEYALRGQLEQGGWRVVGVSWESQTGLEGPFAGWRRHRFLVVGTDHVAAGRGAVVSLKRESALAGRHDVVSTSTDPALRRSGEAVFVVNRLSYDSIQRLDPAEDFDTAWQTRVGAGSNPQDVVVVGSGRGYVSRFEPPFDDVAAFDVEDGDVLASIPLESLAENPDGLPRPSSLAEAGGVAFVALQDINRSFTEYADGKLAVIDPARDELLGSIPLPGKNPRTLVRVSEPDGEKLYVGMAGIFPGLLPQELSGGVAVVDVANRVFERWALDDDTVGANIVDVVVRGPRLGYVLVSTESYVSRVVAFDPESGEPRRVLFESTNFVPELALDSDGVLAVPDTAFASPRLCLYRAPDDPAAAEAALGCEELDLPPIAVEPLD
jgi:hypothetical protein